MLVLWLPLSNHCVLSDTGKENYGLLATLDPGKFPAQGCIFGYTGAFV
jgi:hypothetical protein